MATFIPVFLDKFRSMAHQSFNKKNTIWHPQEYAKAHNISLEAYSNGHVQRVFFSKCYTPSGAVAPFTFVLKKGEPLRCNLFDWE